MSKFPYLKGISKLFGILCFSVIFLSSCAKAKQNTKPNFVFIAVDDLNVYNTVLGELPGNFLGKVYPDSVKRKEIIQKLTPNIDKLSSQGLTFNRAYCQSALCGPSRTALLTGVPPHVSGYYKHDVHFRGYESLTNVITLPQHLRTNGYYTTGVGKIFHKGRAFIDHGNFCDWPDQIYSWSDWINVHLGTGKSEESQVEAKETISKYWEENGRGKQHFSRFGITTVPREESKDYRNAKHISNLILDGESELADLSGEEKKIVLPENKPYFLACGLFAPHLPWVVPQKFFDMFPQEEMEINKQLLDWIDADLTDLSPTGKEKATNSVFARMREYGIGIDGQEGDVNAWKAAFQAYLATVAYSDRNIGVLLDAINNNPQKDNTVVVFWSDHGYHIGDKNREGKTTLWEAANHCNLIIYDPRNPGSSSGLRSNALVSLQDLYPTINSLAGLELPKHVHGYDLSELLQNPDAVWNKPVLNTYEEDNHAIRTDNYRYIRFRNGDVELYDLQNDAFEYVNQANNREFANKVKEMDELLNRTLEMSPNDYRK